MAGIIYRDRCRGMSEVAVVVGTENTQCWNHCESRACVPDGEIQEFNCSLWFHNQVVPVCLFLCWLSCCEHSQWGLEQVIGFPRKTSESVVYQLSGTGFQDWNVGSVQRLLGEVNAHLFV